MALGLLLPCLYVAARQPLSSRSLATANVKTARPENQYLNNVNVRAMRDFISRYGDAEEAEWHQTNTSYVAVFTRYSVRYRVIYTNRGELSYTMKYYEEKKMARNIRAQVKSTYYDYKIFIVQEIETPDHPTIYIINLQGDAGWKKVRLCQGEMELMEEKKG
ncbi:hypothetical protein A3860_31080 [Niastella vici]|uniref:Uncharacterized protein n=1 Tax=Niastella vici TaxID=1703345 RepID=A0A1V9FTQ3_9BACT|nr:hypothetical protein [Niastella vici]OQP61710.1 hypothetical protein A3860_31080 [Niastella vici]